MLKYLIVNADDFGLCEPISKGIIHAYEKGIVTSTSVVANGDYFETGLPLLKKSGIETGIHLTFVGGEKPLLGPIGGLVDTNGRFLKNYQAVIPKILLKQYDKLALQKELFAQAEKMRDSGLSISHMDAHQHLHVLPDLLDLMIHLANQFNIGWARLPTSDQINVKGLGINFFSQILKFRLKGTPIRHVDRCIGFDYSGNLNETRLKRMITGLREGVTEIVIHPGFDATESYDWDFSWNEELKAAVSFDIKKTIRNHNINLTQYSAL